MFKVFNTRDNTGPTRTRRTRLAPRVRAVVDDLERRIAKGELRSGQQLPTVRVLAGQFDVSFGTVHAAMRYLESLGLVEGHHGSGTYVSRKAPGRTRRPTLSPLVFVLVHQQSRTFEDMLKPLVAQLQQMELIAVPVIYNEDDPKEIAHLLSMWRKFPPRAVIAKGRCLHLAEAVMNHCPPHTRLISIFVYPDGPYQHWHNIRPDSFASHRLAAEYLIGKGHRRIGYLTARTGSAPGLTGATTAAVQHPLVALRAAVAEARLPRGLTVHYIDREKDLASLGTDPQSVEGVRRWLTGPQRPSAVLATTARLESARLAAHAADLTIGKDLDLLGIGDDTPALRGEYVCVSEQYDLVYKEAIDLVLADDKQVEGVSRHVLVPPKVVEPVTGAVEPRPSR